MGQAHSYHTQFGWPILGMLELTRIVIFAELPYKRLHFSFREVCHSPPGTDWRMASQGLAQCSVLLLLK